MIQQEPGKEPQKVALDAAARETGDSTRRLRDAAGLSFEQETKCDVDRRIRIEAALPGALARGELSLAWQPMVEATTGKTVCAEALLRWSHRELGAVAPGLFVPIAEQCGLIGLIGGWVLERACAQAQQWRMAGDRELDVAVNVSPLQLDARFVAHVAWVLDFTGLPSSSLELEITEGTRLLDTPSVASAMAALAGLGVKFVIDDFGTGYSTLSYLTRFDVHGLKIDRSFVATVPHQRRSMAVVEGLAKMAHAMGLVVTAEGVETKAQAMFLRGCGIHRMQGFMFGEPLASEDFIDACRDRNRYELSARIGQALKGA